MPRSKSFKGADRMNRYGALLAAVIYTGSVSAQTVDLLCEGTLLSEIFVVGKGALGDPKPVPKTHVYQFIDGRLLTPDSDSNKPVFRFVACAWSATEIRCTTPDIGNQCALARAKGSIPWELLDQCNSLITVNRFSGAVVEEEWVNAREWGGFGKTTFLKTFRGKCEVDAKRKF
jgi:hypothetical protein